VRQKRIDALVERLLKIIETTDFQQPIEPEKMLLIRREEQLINSGLAALRLQQGERRLGNNLTIAVLSFVSGIIGGSAFSYLFQF